MMNKILIGLLALWISPALAQETINNLGTGTTLGGSEQIPMYQGSLPAVTTTPSAIKAYIGPPTGSAGGDLGGTYPNPTLSFPSASAAAAASSTDTFPTNQGAGTLKQTLAAIETWIKSWFLLTGDCSSNSSLVTTCDAPQPGYIASNYYLPGGPVSYTTGAAIGANTIYCGYGIVPRTVTISTLFAGIAVVGTTNLQLAIYTNSNGNPGSLIASTGNISDATATVVTGALGSNVQIGPNGANGGRDIWFCSNQNDSTAAYRAIGTGSSVMGTYLGSATPSHILAAGPTSLVGKACNGSNCQGGSSTFGTWPASLASSTWGDAVSSSVPIIGFQVVSSP